MRKNPDFTSIPILPVDEEFNREVNQLLSDQYKSSAITKSLTPQLTFRGSEGQQCGRLFWCEMNQMWLFEGDIDDSGRLLMDHLNNLFKNYFDEVDEEKPDGTNEHE